MGERIARECMRSAVAGRPRARRTVTVLGLTFKENVPDIRNSKVVDIVRELQSFGVAVQVHDPLADAAAAVHEYGMASAEGAGARRRRGARGRPRHLSGCRAGR